MVPKKPSNHDDPTIEEEAPKFDGTRTDQLDDAYRVRVVAASENENGAVDFDDRGHARWKWMSELGLATTPDDETFDHLKALDNPALSVEQPVPPTTPAAPRKVGYDPYSTAASSRPKTRR